MSIMFPTVDLPTNEEEKEVPDEKVDEEADRMVNEMRERLKALQN